MYFKNFSAANFTAVKFGDSLKVFAFFTCDRRVGVNGLNTFHAVERFLNLLFELTIIQFNSVEALSKKPT